MKDGQGKVDNIQWTVYGKIGSIAKTDGSTLGYGYDPGGNRISKNYVSGGVSTQTYYVRDAQGNVLGVYQYKANSVSGALTEGDWLEQHLYGSSRLGVLFPHVVIAAGHPLGAAYDGAHDAVNDAGNRRYELGNHLGNVLSTVSDARNAVTSGGSSFYTANVISAQDYYPFGMGMPGRTFNVGGYRYGFNGKENDNEVKGEGDQQDYGMRVYDPRLGKFLSVDPIAKDYPELTPYQFASNRPNDGVDWDGKEWELSTPLVNLQSQPQLTMDRKIVWYGTVSAYSAAHSQNARVRSIQKTIDKVKYIPGSGALNILYHIFDDAHVTYTGWKYGPGYASRLNGEHGLTYKERIRAGLNTTALIFGGIQALGQRAIIEAGFQVDLMGGKFSASGKKSFINYDLSAEEGIRDDVSNFKNYFPKNSVREIVVNNPQADFLPEVTGSLKQGGTITIRGQMGNPIFKGIWNGAAEGMEGFEVVPGSRKTGLSTEGYTRTEGSPLRGESNSLNEIVLKKK